MYKGQFIHNNNKKVTNKIAPVYINETEQRFYLYCLNYKYIPYKSGTKHSVLFYIE